MELVIVHPFDPWGRKIGGIATFIRDFIVSSPEHWQISMVGSTSDSSIRPLNQWREDHLNGRKINHLPVVEFAEENKKSAIPRSIPFALNLFRRRRLIRQVNKDAIFQFHRLESMMGLGGITQKKCLVLHFNPEELASSYSEYRWRQFTFGYGIFERRMLPVANKVFLTSKSAHDDFKKRYLKMAGRLQPITQWVDEDLFYPAQPKQRQEKRLHWCSKLPGLNNDSDWIVWVGRKEPTKNPLLALKVMKHLSPRTTLLMVGEGSMDKEVENEAKKIDANIIEVKSLPREQLASLLSASDLFLMTSSFETGPISLLEALASGIPAVATKVGLVPYIWAHNSPGELVPQKADDELLAESIEEVLAHRELYTRDICRKAAEPFFSKKVLDKIYREHETLMLEG